MRFQLIVATALVTSSTARAESDALAKLLARTEAVAKEVSKVRGLPLKKPIPNDVVDRDELRKRLLVMAAEDKTKAETAADAIALARWGMIPLATDYEAMVIDLLTEQIAGYYDPETKKLTISKSAGDDPQWAEMVLAHELDHGLQDQAFDLKKFEEVGGTEGDAAAARRALVEGDGIALMIEVMMLRQGMAVPWANPMVADSIEKAMAVPGNDALDRAPLAIREAMIFPYRAGFTFVAALRRRQPWSAVDGAFAKPPKSTEQIIHPERYLADDPPIPIELDVPASLASFTIAQNTVWGELGFQLFLRSNGVDPAAAATAAAGWGGDRTLVLVRAGDKRPDKAIGLVRSEWDSEADAIEAEEAAVKALDSSVVGAVLENTRTRTKWFGLDGTVSWVERRGAAVVLVRGAPAWAADALATEMWTASRVGKPAKKR
jgi:phosphoserine phosphatase